MCKCPGEASCPVRRGRPTVILYPSILHLPFPPSQLPQRCLSTAPSVNICPSPRTRCPTLVHRHIAAVAVTIDQWVLGPAPLIRAHATTSNHLLHPPMKPPPLLSPGPGGRPAGASAHAQPTQITPGDDHSSRDKLMTHAYKTQFSSSAHAWNVIFNTKA